MLRCWWNLDVSFLFGFLLFNLRNFFEWWGLIQTEWPVTSLEFDSFCISPNWVSYLEVQKDVSQTLVPEHHFLLIQSFFHILWDSLKEMTALACYNLIFIWIGISCASQKLFCADFIYHNWMVKTTCLIKLACMIIKGCIIF